VITLVIHHVAFGAVGWAQWGGDAENYGTGEATGGKGGDGGDSSGSGLVGRGRWLRRRRLLLYLSEQRYWRGGSGDEGQGPNGSSGTTGPT
jgi:hypothetical protein